MKDFEWPEPIPLDVQRFAQCLMHMFNQEFLKQADYNGIRQVRYDPHSDMRQSVIQIVQQFDGMRTEQIKFMKSELIKLHNQTPRPPIVIDRETAMEFFRQQGENKA